MTHSFPTRRASGLGRLRASVLEKPDPVRAEPEAAPSNPFGLSLSKGRSVFSRGRGKDGASTSSARTELGDEALDGERSEEHPSELQSLMRISYAVFCLNKKTSHSQLYTTNI